MPLDPNEPNSAFGFIVFDPERIWELYAESVRARVGCLAPWFVSSCRFLTPKQVEKRDEWINELTPFIGNAKPNIRPRLVGAAALQDRTLKTWSN